MTTSTSDSLPAKLQSFADRFGERLSTMLTADGDAPERLIEAMRYSLLSPGKRLRPFLVVESCALCGGDFDDAFAAAAAVEMVHAFSLIHDDLPSMDDDELRRGQPTNHKKFGEAVAILAGDALLTLAFEVVVAESADPRIGGRLALELARGTGWCGIIGGQAADILGEGHPASQATVEYIHRRKTAALFECSMRMGAISAGAADDAVSALGTYGRDMGLAFQIADDLLDVSSTRSRMGKAVGKDANRAKQTFPACVGIDASRKAADELVERACASLDMFGDKAETLRQLAGFAVSRGR